MACVSSRQRCTNKSDDSIVIEVINFPSSIDPTINYQEERKKLLGYEWVMSQELSVMLQQYAREPVNFFVMEDATTSYCQANHICGDSSCVYLKIVEDVIVAASHAGEETLHTSVAGSILMEVLQGEAIHTVLTRDAAYIASLGFTVSPRRKRASVTALLAARNAIHLYLQDGKEDDFQDLGV